MDTDQDPYAEFSDGRIKHMEMVQTVIARLGGNGFVVKGWAITLVGAFEGFAMTRDHAGLSAVAIVLPPFFWFLDATYLRSERAFRLLFERIRRAEVAPFHMNATAPAYIRTLRQGDQDSLRWRTVIGRPGLSIFYGILMASAIAGTLFLTLTDTSSSAPDTPKNGSTQGSD